MSGARLWVVLGVGMALAGCLMLVAAQQGLDNRLSAMEERIIARIGERFDEVDRRFVEAEVRETERFAEAQDREQERFADVYRRFDDVDRRLGEVNRRLGDIDDRLDQVDGFFELSRQAE